MKIIAYIRLALLCLVGFKLGAQVVPTSVLVSSGGGKNTYVPNNLDGLNYLPIGSFQITKADTIEKISQASVLIYAISEVGYREEKANVPINIPPGSSPSQIAQLVHSQLMSIQVAKPESDYINLNVSLMDKEGNQLFWGYSEFKLIQTPDGTWQPPANAMGPKLRINQNVRNSDLDGVEAIQYVLRDEKGYVINSYYQRLDGRGYYQAYFSGMKGEAYLISRLSDGTRIKKAFSLNSTAAFNTIPGVPVEHQATMSFENVKDDFSVNEQKPRFTIRNANDTHVVGYLEYTVKTDVTLSVPDVFVNGKPVKVGKCDIVFRKFGTEWWGDVYVTDDAPAIQSFEPGKYWIYVDINIFGQNPENSETYPPYDEYGDGRG